MSIEEIRASKSSARKMVATWEIELLSGVKFEVEAQQFLEAATFAHYENVRKHSGVIVSIKAVDL